jgi:hypothetical protein
MKYFTIVYTGYKLTNYAANGTFGVVHGINVTLLGYDIAFWSNYNGAKWMTS